MSSFIHTLSVCASEFYFGEEQIYIHTLVLKGLRLDLMRTLESSQQPENKNKLGTLEMYIYIYC